MPPSPTVQIIIRKADDTSCELPEVQHEVQEYLQQSEYHENGIIALLYFLNIKKNLSLCE